MGTRLIAKPAYHPPSNCRRGESKTCSEPASGFTYPTMATAAFGIIGGVLVIMAVYLYAESEAQRRKPSQGAWTPAPRYSNAGPAVMLGGRAASRLSRGVPAMNAPGSGSPTPARGAHVPPGHQHRHQQAAPHVRGEAGRPRPVPRSPRKAGSEPTRPGYPGATGPRTVHPTVKTFERPCGPATPPADAAPSQVARLTGAGRHDHERPASGRRRRGRA